MLLQWGGVQLTDDDRHPRERFSDIKGHKTSPLWGPISNDNKMDPNGLTILMQSARTDIQYNNLKSSYPPLQ